MDFMPKKQLLEDQLGSVVDGQVYRVQHEISDFHLMDIPEDYVQVVWQRMYEDVFRRIAYLGMGTQDNFVLRITPTVRHDQAGITAFRVEAEIHAVRYKNVLVPKYEEYPVTLPYIWREWKTIKKYQIKRWWKGLFK